MKKFILLAFLLSSQVVFAENKPSSINEAWPYYFASRVYASSENNGFEALLGIERMGFDFSVGGYFPFQINPEEEKFSGDISLHVAKRIELSPITTLKLGVGMLGSDPYLDYGLEFKVNSHVALSTGYRYHLQDDNDRIDSQNKNEIYLGFKIHFNQPAIIKIDNAPIGVLSDNKPTNTQQEELFTTKTGKTNNDRVTEINGYAKKVNAQIEMLERQLKELNSLSTIICSVANSDCAL